MMKPVEYRQFMVPALAKRKRVLSVGPPGVGKTDLAVEAANEVGMDTIVLCSALEDPSSIRGYPSRGSDGRATHCLFDGIAKAFDSVRPTLLFFDDLGMSSESTMRSIMRLVQHGEIDDRKLPDHVVICGATNDVQHGAGVYGMLEPLKTRFHTIINVETDLDDVVSYGLGRGWPSDLLAYLRNTPQALHDWKPSKSMSVDGACPRGWSYVASWINDGIDNAEVISGCVGKGRATEYLAFRDLIKELPDIDGVLLNPDTAPVPENPSACFLVSMAIASRMTGSTFGSCIRYLGRMRATFRTFSIRDAMRGETERIRNKLAPKDYRPISSSRDFAAWVSSSDGKNIVAAGS